MPKQVKVEGRVITVPDDATPDEIDDIFKGQTGVNPGQDAPPSFAEKHPYLNTGLDVLKGAGKGLLNTGTSLSPLINKIPGIGETLAPSVGIRAANQIKTPINTAQKVGYYGEQAGEWLLPTGLESKAGAGTAKLLSSSPNIAKFAVPAAKIATSAAEGSVRNKLQGGDLATGAVMGAVPGVIGEVGKAYAPGLARMAAGIKPVQLAHGSQPGEAILNETKGIRPLTIARQLEGKIADNAHALDAAADAPGIATANPAVGIVDDATALQSGARQNSQKTSRLLGKVRNQLTKEHDTGAPIISPVSPRRILDLRRGIEGETKSWAPYDISPVEGTLHNVYGALSGQLHDAVPATAPIDAKLSSLIPAKEGMMRQAYRAGLGENIAGRVGAHTGALTSAVAGGIAGHSALGTPGTLVGGAAGLIVPEIASLPATKMMAARVLNADGTPRVIRAIGSPVLPRKSDEEEDDRQ